MLRRHRELDAEIAQHERNMREGEARLPIEEQLTLKTEALYRGKLFEKPGYSLVGCSESCQRRICCRRDY
jgi:hypothetical protein